MTSALRYETVSLARAHLKEVLDAAAEGRPAHVERGRQLVAVVDAPTLRRFLALRRPSGAVVVAENDGWTVTVPGLPIAADGDTVAAALDEVVAALREYAEDWTARLRLAPNHRQHWDVVQLVELSSDEQLREWLVAAPAS